jgi:hypothetical protein
MASKRRAAMWVDVLVFGALGLAAAFYVLMLYVMWWGIRNKKDF